MSEAAKPKWAIPQTRGERWAVNLFAWACVSGLYLLVSYTTFLLVGFTDFGRPGGVTDWLTWVFALPVRLLWLAGMTWAGTFEALIMNAAVYGAVLWFGGRLILQRWNVRRTK